MARIHGAASASEAVSGNLNFYTMYVTEKVNAVPGVDIVATGDILDQTQQNLDDIVNIDNSISEYKNKYYREVENQNIVLDKYESKIINLTRENQTMSSELIALKNKTNIAVVTSVVSLLLMLVLAVIL